MNYSILPSVFFVKQLPTHARDPKLQLRETGSWSSRLIHKCLRDTVSGRDAGILVPTRRVGMRSRRAAPRVKSVQDRAFPALPSQPSGTGLQTPSGMEVPKLELGNQRAT